MGCKNSKAREPPADTVTAAQANIATNKNSSTAPTLSPAQLHVKQTGETKRNNAASPTSRGNNGEASENESRIEQPKKALGPGGNDVKQAASNSPSKQELDDEGNPLLLPNGDWVRTEGTPFYYSVEENLYFHPPSCQFYDPTNGMWYDPEKDEWYYDDENGAQE
ncbi:hypothetical protein C3747_60g62 [Trypanosoma cruzi]|uniref:OCRE domain-containing protein n=1 Tax=Trypanosoma cruzi TaxID=5693 RepID=A0A2V2WSZ0_TRYCR|nr:hypothetical protein C3747_60g62 [Trypanosoma cruzi]RNC39802.1 hypothetical protein TcCL_NonESM10802 [Trypanosoma cruzi]